MITAIVSLIFASATPVADIPAPSEALVPVDGSLQGKTECADRTRLAQDDPQFPEDCVLINQIGSFCLIGCPDGRRVVFCGGND